MKNLPAKAGVVSQELRVRSLEEQMTSHSSILAWKIPWSLVGYSPWGHKESDMAK